VDSAQFKTPGMSRNSTRENRDTPSPPVPATGWREKSMSSPSRMHDGGESDGRIVPTKGSNNNDGQPSAESLEGRGPAKENIEQPTPPRTQSRTSESRGLLGVREVHVRTRKHGSQRCSTVSFPE
jgi:hypothetical protein